MHNEHREAMRLAKSIRRAKDFVAKRAIAKTLFDYYRMVLSLPVSKRTIEVVEP